jgi:FkbM family methyltransferase
MNIGNRSLGRVVNALKKRRSYRAFLNIFRTLEGPLYWAKRYLTNRGDYPATVRVKTPSGVWPVDLFFPDDLQTVVEIFCRNDYPVDEGDRIAIDIGGNIGVFTLFFLSRHKENRCYTYEPDPKNLARAEKLLSANAARVHLTPVAVHWERGILRFNTEETGRYGRLQKEGESVPPHVTVIKVECVEINDVIREVIAKEGRVDVIKVDVEGNEVSLLQHISPDLYPHINRIIFETNNEPPIFILCPRALTPEEFNSRVRPFIMT